MSALIIRNDSFVLVDLRSSQECKEEHVVGKEIIVYCYSIPCMTGRKTGKMLSDNGRISAAQPPKASHKKDAGHALS